MARYRGRWRPYVRVTTRQARAARYAAAIGGENARPVVIEGRQIAHTFWGQAWCEHLERFSDFENRLPRGRSYVRNGSVCHLEIAAGEVRAVVVGSDLYDVAIDIDPLAAAPWRDLKGRCAGQIGSLLELLQGRLSEAVMAQVCDPERGLFPLPRQIHLSCSCPDWAVMCKHVAAVLYGVGARLDEEPELLFVLRGVDHEELIDVEAGEAVTSVAPADARRRLAEADLGDIFGIELSGAAAAGDEAAGEQPAAPAASVATHGADTPQADAGGEALARFGPRTGAEVAALRRAFGMTQGELGLLLGVSGPAVSSWERRREPPPIVRRVRDLWADVVALSPDEAWLCLEVLGG